MLKMLASKISGDKIFFIEDCFRKVADMDYIAARATFRLGLPLQFFNLAQQALEKYLKGILLFDDQNIRNIGHDITAAYENVVNIPYLKCDFTTDVKLFVERVNYSGDNRDKEVGFCLTGNDLQMLDKSIWYIRRYCQPLCLTDGHDPVLSESDYWAKLDYLQSETLKKSSYRLRVPRGYLEGLIDRTVDNEPARQALVWNNFNFSGKKRRKFSVTSGIKAGNPIHLWNPQLFEELLKKVYFSKKNITRIRDGHAKLKREV